MANAVKNTYLRRVTPFDTLRLEFRADSLFDEHMDIPDLVEKVDWSKTGFVKPDKKTLHVGSPFTAGILAILFPGAGYFYLGDNNRGVLSVPLLIPLAIPHYIQPEDAKEYAVQENLALMASKIHQFTIYDSYQSSLDLNGRPQQVVDVPHYSFLEMASAPFSAETYALQIPKGGSSDDLITAFGNFPILVLYLQILSHSVDIGRQGIHSSVTTGKAISMATWFFGLNLLIGVGEEAEHRGFELPAFAELTGSPLAGNVLSSLTFGMCHTSYGFCGGSQLIDHLFAATRTTNPPIEQKATQSVHMRNINRALTATASGFLYGLPVMAEGKNGLWKSVTAHTLWNFTLSMSEYLTTGKAYQTDIWFNLPTVQF